MSFRWLPDADTDPHPRVTWLAEYCFSLALSTLYRIDADYPPAYELAPGTLVVSNHLRDADAPILANVLCRREGLRINWPLPFFASREDLFRPDFLDDYLQGWPQPLRSLLGRIPLTWLFRIMRAEPIRRVREFTIANAIAELPRTRDRIHWLNHRGRQEITGTHVDTPHPENKPPEQRDWGLRRLHGRARQTLAPTFRATVDSQLDHLAALLDAGRQVYLAPEGRNSRNGCFGRVRAGVWQIVQRTQTPPVILPLGLSYDALQPGRLRALVKVGHAQNAHTAEQRAPFDAALEQSIRQLYTLNTSHLLSRFLAAGPAEFSSHDLGDWLGDASAQLANAGTLVDRRLREGDCHDIARKRLQWLRRKKLVTRTRSSWRNNWPESSPPGWQQPAHIIRYCDNALADHLRACAPDLSLMP